MDFNGEFSVGGCSSSDREAADSDAALGRQVILWRPLLPHGGIRLKARQIPARFLTSMHLNANRDLNGRPPSCATRLFNCKEKN